MGVRPSPRRPVLSLTEGSSAEAGEWLLDDIVTGMERAMRRGFGLDA